MSIRDRLTAALDSTGSDVRETAPTEAWRPRLELDSSGGFFVTRPFAASEMPDQSSLLQEFDLDPTQWEVVNVRKSRWQKYDGEWLEAYRVTVKPYAWSQEDEDITDIIAKIEKWKPSKGRAYTGNGAFVLCTGDTQYGKDANGGTSAIVDRMLTGIDEGVQRYHELNRLGRNLGTVVLPQLGDCIEGTVSQGGKVLGRLDLGVTAQVRIGRRVLLAQIKAFAPICERIIVPVVPGNHDEPHRAVLTDPTDSWQIEIASAVQDGLELNPDAFGHVEFRYPDRDEQTLAIDVHGTMLGFAHGHQSRDAVKWWQGQSAGKTPVGQADVLVTGHFHHFRAQQVGPRLWIQVPAMDGGSAWFRDKTGLDSPTGLVSFVVGEGRDPRADMSVLAGEWR